MTRWPESNRAEGDRVRALQRDAGSEVGLERDSERHRTSLLFQSGALLFGRGFGFLVSFTIPIVLVRLLDQSLFGQYKQYFLIALTIVQAVDFGLAASLFYFLPAGGKARGRFISNALLVLMPLAIVVFLLGILQGPRLAAWMSAPELARVTPILGAYAALMLVTQFAEQLPVIEQQPRLAALVAFGSELTRATLLIGSVAIWSSLDAIAWASLLYALARVSFVIGYCTRLYRRRLLEVSLSGVGEMVRYAVPFGLAGLTQVALTRGHQYYVGGLTDPSTFAIYAVGCLAIPVTHLFYAALADVALVRTAELYKHGNVDAVRCLYRNLARALGSCAIPTYVFVAFFSAPIVAVLFTERFLAAAPILVVFSVRILFYPIADHVVLRSFGATRFIFWASIAGLAANVVALVPLYSIFGLGGAAASYVVGLATSRLLGLIKVSQLLACPVVRLMPIRAFALIAVSSLVSGWASRFIFAPLRPLPELLVGALIFGAIYAVLIWYLGVLKPLERRRILEFIGQLLRWVRPQEA